MMIDSKRTVHCYRLVVDIDVKRSEYAVNDVTVKKIHLKQQNSQDTFSNIDISARKFLKKKSCFLVRGSSTEERCCNWTVMIDFI